MRSCSRASSSVRPPTRRQLHGTPQLRFGRRERQPAQGHLRRSLEGLGGPPSGARRRSSTRGARRGSPPRRHSVAPRPRRAAPHGVGDPQVQPRPAERGEAVQQHLAHERMAEPHDRRVVVVDQEEAMDDGRIEVIEHGAEIELRRTARGTTRRTSRAHGGDAERWALAAGRCGGGPRGHRRPAPTGRRRHRAPRARSRRTGCPRPGRG